MGGIKNREAKRAANKVVNGVGQGSAAEAEQFLAARAAASRNQLQCPHCDRVFTELLKLNNHVKQKHADVVVEASPSASASASAPAVKGTGKQGKQLRIMDIGSSAGAYDYKSPKLLVHEMLLKAKAPKARYKTIFEKDTSTWRCKVVLPDSKKKEDDVVLFLDKSDACEDEQEAQQRAAVLALHHLAGNRSLERTLPPSYVELWKATGEKSKVREERVRRAAERERREKEIKARAIKKELSGQGPVQITMTDEHRAAIEGILQEVNTCDDDDDDDGGGGDGVGPSSRSPDEIAELAAELEALGFGREDASTAAAKRAGLSSALDWLCLNLPEDRLPSEFAAGAAGKPVTVIRRSGVAPAEVVDPAVTELERCGYGRSEAMEALASHKGDVFSSAVALFLSSCAAPFLPGFFGSEDDYERRGAPGGDLVEEERMALEAIFGDDVSFDGNVISVRLETARVQFVLPRRYPDACPAVIVQSTASAFGATGVSGRQIRHLMTSTVLPALVEAAGAPAVYDVASLVGESISDLPDGDDGDDDGVGVGVGDGLDDGVGAGDGLNDGDDNGDGDNRGVADVARPPPDPYRKRPKFALSPAQVQQESERLAAHHRKLENDASHGRMRKQRAGLPAASMRAEVVEAVNGSMVTIIMGSTGCGKSTQVPQFILEDAISQSRGGECNIICTQPRRISAIGLAHRVAQERAESVGSTIGYSVRLDSKQSMKQTRLLFCTTGVMLRKLLSDPELKSVTHVVLDEVHERTIEGDLLLFLLRDLLLSGKNRNIKIVLMSATAEAELFAGYFSKVGRAPRTGAPPVISIPGFTHPVQDFFLEDVLEATGYLIGKTSKWAKKNVKDEEEAAARYRDAGYSEATAKSMAVVNESNINVDLIEALVCHVIRGNRKAAKGAKPAAILIFVPGAYMITKLVKKLSSWSSGMIKSVGSEVRVLPLHGGLPPSEQSKVFDRPPPGVTKIVVATNVAETSITIDDVTCVIDSGKANEVRFDALKGISRLQEVFVSQASCQQRRGRAGRVQPGICYRIFSKKIWGNMEKNTLPEISRSALHSLVMDTKAIVGGDVYDVLDQMLTPPPRNGLIRAVHELELIGAIDADSQSLTPLGKHLSRMPCDPKLGKMLIFGAILRCVDPVLTIVAAQAYGKSVWYWSTQDGRQEAEGRRAKLVSSLTGASSSYSSSSTKSDHIATIAAFNGWRLEHQRSGHKAARRYAEEYFISVPAMEAIGQGRRQFAQILADLGFISPSYLNSVGQPALAEDGQPANSAYGEPDEYAGHARVVKAALAAGFYPQLLRVENPAARFQKVDGGAFETEGPGGKVKLFDRERGRVFLHPSSINFPVGKFESGWLVYSDIFETTKVYVRECSMVPVYAVILFAGNVVVHHEQGKIVVDGWATFKAPARIGVLVREMRQVLETMLDKKIKDARYDVLDSEKRLIDALHQLLASDGF